MAVSRVSRSRRVPVRAPQSVPHRNSTSVVRRLGGSFPLAAALVLVAAGCSGAAEPAGASAPEAGVETGGEPGREASAAPPEGARPDWRVDDGTGEPVFPPAGETLPGEDAQGAQTAAVSYLGMYYDGLRTGSSEELRAHSEQGCDYCTESVLAVDAAGDQGWRLDPAFSWGATDVFVSVPTESSPLHRVLLDVTEGDFVMIGPDGEPVRQGATESGTLDMALRRSTEGWRVVEVVPLSPERAAELRESAG